MKKIYERIGFGVGLAVTFIVWGATLFSWGFFGIIFGWIPGVIAGGIAGMLWPLVLVALGILGYSLVF